MVIDEDNAGSFSNSHLSGWRIINVFVFFGNITRKRLEKYGILERSFLGKKEPRP